MPQKHDQPNPVSQPPDEHDDDLEMAEGEEFEGDDETEDDEIGTDEAEDLEE